MSDDLRPCPFCGCSAEMCKDGKWFTILCSAECHMTFAQFSNEEYLRKAWNGEKEDSDET